MSTKEDAQDLEREIKREQAIIQYQKRDEVEMANQEYELSLRKPARIDVSIPVKHEVQSNTLPF